MPRLWMLMTVAALGAWPVFARDGSGNAGLPEFREVEKAIAEHFQAIKDHRPTDLISRDQASGVFDALEELGWQVADRGEILEQVLPESDALVKRLRTKNGRSFMRQSARYPQAYDRLDRLERMSDGQRMLKQLVDGPDGYKLIEYLTTSSGGKNMGKMLSAAPHGEQFNKATGRIYTQEQLLQRLKQSHDSARGVGGPPARSDRRSATR